ncbi:MAG TPA: Ig-like domain-containing protein [Candidatus Limnocylindrales bacterium]|nr:Ig-like domain-containing protein [Candidatus Limnocylindrales bacterium]
MGPQGGLVGRLAAGSRRLRSGWRPWLASRTGVELLTAIVVATLVVTVLPNGRPLTDTDPGASPRPTGTPAATPGTTMPPDEAWGDLTLPAWEPVAELRPVDEDASGVALGSAFTLRSRTTTPAAELAGGVTTDPAIELTVEPGTTPAEVRLVPAVPMAPGTLYRFRLADPTGALAGSWAYRTERPLHVVGTLPQNEATGVPINTGIEVEFDQDGITGIGDRFTIDPTVAGRLELHGRTAVFVPTAALAPASIYTVTIAAGVGMTGSEQVLEQPVTFAFETAAPSGSETWDVGLGRPIIEASPGERPIIAVSPWYDDTAPGAITSLPFEVHRLPSFEAARSAAATLSAAPSWNGWSSLGLIPTEGLPRVAAFEADITEPTPSGYVVVELPAPLPAGWYVVAVPREGRDRQAILQVTDLAAYVLTSETRTIAWVNDRATGRPVVGAELLGPNGTRVGVTGTDGLLDVPSPAALRRGPADGQDGTRPPELLTVVAPDGRRLLAPLGIHANSDGYDEQRNGWGRADEPWNQWWLLTSTDRTTYRSTDVIHAWGVIRSRDDRSVPADLEATLRAAGSSASDGPWLTRVPVDASDRGTWGVDLPIEDLPLGAYVVELRVAGTVADAEWIGVAELRKPAYEIEVETDRRAAIAGDPVTITARAVFFDGTSAAGLELRVTAFGQTRVVTAGLDGRATIALPARGEWDGVSSASVVVTPASPEEGEISGFADVLVIPASVWLKATAQVRDGRVVVDGSVHRVDLARVEAELAAGAWPEDPSGDPVAGATVTVRVVEMIPVTKQIGTQYDYIEKRAVPIFETTTTEKAVGTYTTTSGPGGVIALSVPVPDAAHAYDVRLTSRDASGRAASAFTSATAALVQPPTDLVRPYLEEPESCGWTMRTYATGDPMRLTMYDGSGAISSGGRYLFVIASRGIREIRLQDEATLLRTFAESDLPSLHVMAIRFEGGVYVASNEILIRTRPTDRTLDVGLAADRDRYAPGERATVTIRTTGANGDPVAADVVVRGVDEKLFATGNAFETETLEALLAPTPDGLLQSYLSHPVPLPRAGDGCGDTGGGRDDFRDSILFRVVSTDADGRASVSFDLPDDLTSWRVSATAVAADVRAGDASILLPVGLPFFVDATLASDYLAGERPMVRLRSFGDDLASGDRVRFTVSAPSLLMAATTVEAAAFASVLVPLPELGLGSHAVTIQASVVGDPDRTDTLVRTVVARSSRLQVATTEVGTADSAAGLGGPGLTTYVVTDAGRGSLVPLLQDLANGGGARFDRLLAADIAAEILRDEFGFDDASLPVVELDVDRYERGGIALLPYSSPDLPLTALAAVVAPDRFDPDALELAFREWMQDDVVTRERRIIALAGLAGLGRDVLDELRAVPIAEVSVREALWVALGLVASGDEDGARAIERSLLEELGQELGPYVRLGVPGPMVASIEATALLALVATAIGDPLATPMSRYVREMATTEAIFVLSEVGVVRWSLDRLPRAAARFAWTVDGDRHVESLLPGEAWSIPLTERQRSGFRLESLDGEIAVIASWTGMPGPGDLPAGGLVTITRTVTPAADAPSTGLVRVSLRVSFDATALTGCWEVTDRTPSGLAPVAGEPGWTDDLDHPRPVYAPIEVTGQLVRWCVDPSDGRTAELRYAARVVTPGTFTWEPAVIQHVAAPEVGATTPATTYTIR